MSGRTHIKRFRARRDSVPAARRHVESILTEWKLGGLIDETTLLASELSTNVVNHAKGAGDYFELGLRRRNGTLLLEVSDSYQWRMPTLRTPTLDDLSGRGLVIVDAVAAKWGVRPRDPGKTVWVHLTIGQTELT
ncbi:ATP-binding protein [Streptomyces sp. NBC_00984]|uniref:ATP-binding protein n=1 Tax=Streptomyces sp. NBC_00984 TaxID=2903700 RepID=UPI0038666F9E|nr:ATP-binding protein [Streptomyces sp. NBC_00984]